MANEMLNIKVKNITKLQNCGAVKALCDLSFGDFFLIKGFGIVENEKGFFVSMPRKVSKSGRWFNVFIPATKEIKEYLSEVVMDAYKESLE